MAVLIGLIIVDLIVIGLVLYFVVREPHPEAPKRHPYVLEDEQQRAASERGEPVQES